MLPLAVIAHPVEQIPETFLTTAALDTSRRNIRDAVLFGQIDPDQSGCLANDSVGEPAKNALYEPMVSLSGFNDFIKNTLVVSRDTVLPLCPSEVV